MFNRTRISRPNSGVLYESLCGGVLALFFLILIGLCSVVLAGASSYFIPREISKISLTDGDVIYGQIVEESEDQLHLRVGSREIFGHDFKWIKHSDVLNREIPQSAIVIERLEWGDVYGAVIKSRSTSITSDQPDSISIDLGAGGILKVSSSDIVRKYMPNQLNFFGKVQVSLSKFIEFLGDYPRESNSEGGVFPAIFGTVLLVFLMSLFVTPLGVLAAIYLHEYAKQGFFVSLVRICVNNLAGVPSIVFGVFGLGFFVYVVGGGIDRMFFGESLPTPTFGTGGLLWASLTLALLTVPTVIVATEEGLSAISNELRSASYALGATKYETTVKVVLPSLAPAIMTGVILAISRAAGEVAPLMLTGVVKLAPSLSLDGEFPFLHLERKFMHLGFHIYDVGFQSPNAEAAKEIVFATTALLIILVVSANLFAIVLRQKLRNRLETSGI